MTKRLYIEGTHEFQLVTINLLTADDDNCSRSVKT